MKLGTSIFDVGARFYDFITNHEVWRRHCREMAALVPGPRVLDLGIGPGVSGIEMTRAAPGSWYVGLDLSAPMLARARKNVARSGVQLPLVRADAGRLPFADGAFDGAAAHSFLYLVPDAELVLDEVYRVVRPGGRVAFMEPREGGVLRLGPAAAQNLRFGISMALWRVASRVSGRYAEDALAALLERHGFREAQCAPTLGGLGLIATGIRQ